MKVKGSLRIGRIAGIEVRIHFTWLFIFALVVWSLAQGFFPQLYPGWDTTTYWVMGVVAAILLFVSVLLHELAHSLIARRRGMSVSSITLFIFGGVSNLTDEPKKPKAEFIMAIAGPLSSLALAGIFWGLLQFTSDQQSPLAAMFSYLSLINLFLGIFNLLPGFPLDGGRVLRSFIWQRTGDIVKATNIAATVGRFLGWGLVGFGVFLLLTGNFLGGLWIAFIGWFLSNTADASRREVVMREQLRGVLTREVMDSNVEPISPETTVQQVVQDILRRRRHRAVPVAQNNRVIGIITVTDIKELQQDQGALTPVE